MYITNPRKDRNSVTLLGGGQSRMACTFLSSIFTRPLLTICPKNIISFWAKQTSPS